MSYDLIVYTRRERIPSSERLAKELAQATPKIVPASSMPELGAEHDGHVPLWVDGVESGFELSSRPISPDWVERYREDLAGATEVDDADHEFLRIITVSDTTLTFRCHDQREIATASVVAETVARLSHGFLCDPQADTVWDASGSAT